MKLLRTTVAVLLLGTATLAVSQTTADSFAEQLKQMQEQQAKIQKENASVKTLNEKLNGAEPIASTGDMSATSLAPSESRTAQRCCVPVISRRSQLNKSGNTVGGPVTVHAVPCASTSSNVPAASL